MTTADVVHRDSLRRLLAKYADNTAHPLRHLEAGTWVIDRHAMAAIIHFSMPPVPWWRRWFRRKPR